VAPSAPWAATFSAITLPSVSRTILRNYSAKSSTQSSNRISNYYTLAITHISKPGKDLCQSTASLQILISKCNEINLLFLLLAVQGIVSVSKSCQLPPRPHVSGTQRTCFLTNRIKIFSKYMCYSNRVPFSHLHSRRPILSFTCR
jgi:hypothetical protein